MCSSNRYFPSRRGGFVYFIYCQNEFTRNFKRALCSCWLGSQDVFLSVRTCILPPSWSGQSPTDQHPSAPGKLRLHSNPAPVLASSPGMRCWKALCMRISFPALNLGSPMDSIRTNLSGDQKGLCMAPESDTCMWCTGGRRGRAAPDCSLTSLGQKPGRRTGSWKQSATEEGELGSLLCVCNEKCGFEINLQQSD